MEERGGPPRRAQGAAGGVAGTWPPRRAVEAGRFAPARFDVWTSFLAKLQIWARAEVSAWQLLPWVPVAFGTGIAVYFSAEHEPVLPVAALTATMLCVGAFVARRRKFFPVLVLVAAVAAGFAAATWRTERVAHTVLSRALYSVQLAGFVETREIRARTDRFVLRVTHMETPRSRIRLERVRLSVKKGTAPRVGSFVKLKAHLQPPLSSLRPGGHNFARDMFFQEIGASGFVMGPISVVQPPESGGLLLRYDALMQNLRDDINARVRTRLHGDELAIATTLLTGRRDAITEPVRDAIYISGLAHVLAIAGFHMAIVAGVVFFWVRALLALIPGLAIGFPIKKWSAAAALGAAGFYLLLSGLAVATQRAYFMAAVVLIGVMVDRRAITFRTLALAAMVVLATQPEALLGPSFQLSFAATLCLVAFVQLGMPHLFATPDSSLATRIALWGGREAATIVLVSFIAGLATIPYAAFHFHRVAPYGVIANLLVMPVISTVVMPAGILGLLAVPFGLDGFFWHLMGIGIGWMISVTQWVAALPGSIGPVAAFGTGPVIVATIGIILMGLLRTPLRWSGALVLGVAVLWAVLPAQPDVLVSANGHVVAVRGSDRRFHLMIWGRNDAFLINEWLVADADPRPPGDASLGDGVSCDESGCVTAMADGALVAQTQEPEGLADDCARALLVVTEVQAPRDCAATVIDREQLWHEGALALWRNGRKFTLQAVRPNAVDRPWTPARDETRVHRKLRDRHPPDATPPASALPTGSG